MNSIVNLTTTNIESSDDTKQLHDHVFQLLPWYVNESLSSDERTLVEEHLSQCQLCQQALADDLVMMKIPESNIEVPNLDKALDKMMRRIEFSSGTATKYTPSFSQRMRKKWLRPISIPMAWLVLPQFAALLIIAVSLTDLMKHEPNYQALSSGNAIHSNVVVVFKSQATLADVSDALQRFDAKIVDGPTVTNAYLLHVPNEKIVQVVNGLRIDKNVEYIHQLIDGEKYESLPN